MRYSIIPVNGNSWFIYDDETKQVTAECHALHLAQLVQVALNEFDRKVKSYEG